MILDFFKSREQFELALVPVVVLDLIQIFFRTDCSSLPHDFAFVSCHLATMATQDSIAETEQSRLNKMKKDCEISTVRELCMNESRPRFTFSPLCCKQWTPQKKNPPSPYDTVIGNYAVKRDSDK